MKISRKAATGLLLLIAAVLTALSGCSGDNNTATEGETDDIKGLVQDYSLDNVPGETASITSHELIVTKEDDSEITYDLPEDEFFVSIAPYVSQTHP